MELGTALGEVGCGLEKDALKISLKELIEKVCVDSVRTMIMIHLK